MNFLKNSKEKEFIILKDGYNIPLIFGIISVIICMVILISTKYFLPDGRDKMTYDVDQKLSFIDSTITINSKYYWNKDIQVGQIEFEELNISGEDIDLKITVKTDEGKEMPISIIEGHSTEEEIGSLVMKRKYILQYGMPKDVYYLLFNFEVDGVSYRFTIDYRDFVKKDIFELDSNYLKEKETLLNENISLEGQKQMYENELNAIEKLSQEEKFKQEEHKKNVEKSIVDVINKIEVNIQKIKNLESGC